MTNITRRPIYQKGAKPVKAQILREASRGQTCPLHITSPYSAPPHMRRRRSKNSCSSLAKSICRSLSCASDASSDHRAIHQVLQH